ncbi:low-density lipoprotein receptor-related protein 2-like [Saccostrea echinata]|uniref:low-density lipoprotein receptor-related protein 2-like n=1 Tax=Saccostrea echinata TaxID=191078 RepID=UPI002A80B795|nr:low-density lipoprotein receptor-related protein 2-like [Saccostrea echinata]
MSTTLHGKNRSLLYSTGFAFAERLTIDYSTGNIYYSAVASIPSQSYIGVVHRQSFLHKTLLSNLHRPKDIVLYPSRGYLYWTKTGSIKEIGRSYMDGTSKMYIATTNIGAPTGLAIDFTSNRLYWTDAIKNRIEYSDLNGGNRHVLTTDKDACPFGIIVHRQYLYYIASNRQGVTKINKATGSKVTFMSIHPELGVLNSLDVYTDDSVDLSLSCSTNNGSCSAFCFPTPNGRTCGCADDVDLKSDQTTCQGVSRCTTSLRNVNLHDCIPYPEHTCNIHCKSGYRLRANVSLMCDHSGQWVPSPVSLCTEIFCTSAIKHVKLSSSCTQKAAESCKFSCNDGYTPTTSESLLCTDMGTWSHNTRNLCLRNTSSQHNSEDDFEIYNMYVYIGSSIAAISGIIFPVTLAIACFLKRKNTSRDTYQTSPVHTEHNYSIIRNRGHLTGINREEGQKTAEYVTIDDQFITEYVEPIDDRYLYPCGHLTGSYREEGQEPAEYIATDDQFITEYVEPMKDMHLNPGLILGMWNPASLTSITEIPRNPASHFGNVSMFLNPSGAQIISISSDPERTIVFAAIGYSIYAFQNFTIWQNETIPISVVYRGRSIGNAQIAFDYVSKNLYWCDSLLNWIAMKPAYLDNTTIYKLIIHNNLKQPEGLALDPEAGLMFFSDNDVNPRIEKASMNGDNRTVIVHTGLKRVLSLSVDVINSLLYWADYGRHTVEVSDYYGLNRKVLRRSNNVPATGLHFYEGMLHVVSSGARAMFGVDAASGTQLYSLRMNTAQPYAVHVYDAETSKEYIDPCTSRSCQHICVNTPEGAKCLCAEGYLISSDGMTCTDRSWFHEKGFILHNSTAFSMYEVHFVNGRRGLYPIITVPSSIIQTFAVDANMHLIYFVDNSNNKLKELNIISFKIRTLTSIQFASDFKVKEAIQMIVVLVHVGLSQQLIFWKAVLEKISAT